MFILNGCSHLRDKEDVLRLTRVYPNTCDTVDGIPSKNSQIYPTSIDLEVTTDLCGGVHNPNSRVSGLCLVTLKP